MVAKKKASKGKGQVKKRKTVRSLSLKAASQVRGGKRADGTGGGNVAAGWNLIGNKVHA